jgi:hypothetical protein
MFCRFKYLRGQQTTVSRATCCSRATGRAALVKVLPSSGKIPLTLPTQVHFCSSPDRPDLLWGPSSLSSCGYRGIFPRGENGGRLNLITLLPSVSKSRIRGSVRPLSHTRRVWLSVGATLFYVRDCWPLCQAKGGRLTLVSCTRLLLQQYATVFRVWRLSYCFQCAHVRADMSLLKIHACR